LIASGMTFEYYHTYWAGLSNYYGLHVDIVERHAWSFDGAMPQLKNIPGYMMWHRRDSWWTMALSWTSHLVPLVALSRPGAGPDRIGCLRSRAPSSITPPT